MAAPLRMRMSVLLVLLAAAAHAPWCRGQPPAPAPRYCHCVFQGQRHTANKQVCFPIQGFDEQSRCRSEMVPYLPDIYQPYTNEPQRLFRVFTLVADAKTARKVCSEEGGRLAAPENGDMFRFVAHLMKKAGLEWALINYTDEQKEGVWTYDDGTPAPKLPWGQGQPDNWKGDEDCTVQSDKATVSDIDCKTRWKFVCERPVIKKIPKGYRWHNVTKMFYKLYTQEKPFHLAKKTCELDGGKLAAPEDYDQVVCLIHTMKKYTTAYVDFTDEAEEGNFITSEGISIDEMEFQVWRQGEPDNGAPYDVPENCVVFHSGGYYMDVPCGHTKPFACQLVPY